MRFYAGALVIMLAGCAAGSGGSDRPDGCALFDQAASAFADVDTGLQDQTMTPDDLAAAMDKIRGKLSDVAVIAPAKLAGHARAGSAEAGRVRVALLGSGGSVKSDAAALRADMDAMLGICG